MTVESLPPPPPPDPIPPPPFSPLAFIGGLLLVLIVGGVANVFSALIGADTHQKPLAFLIGMIPGAVFIALSSLPRGPGFARGLLVGGCIIGLLGGVCGASFVGVSFH